MRRRFDVCRCWKCEYWLCSAIRSMWNGYFNYRTRISKFGRLHWNCDKFSFVGLFGGYNWTSTCFTDCNGRKFHMCSLIGILHQCDIVDSESALCRNFVSYQIRLKWTNILNLKKRNSFFVSIIAVYLVFKHRHTHILGNSIAMTHAQKHYHLWQCLCPLVLYICHCLHGQLFHLNGNSIYLMCWQ